MLCQWRKNHEEPCHASGTLKEVRRSVLQQQLVQGLIQNSFRSSERVAQQHAQRNRSMQMARCTRLLETNNK